MAWFNYKSSALNAVNLPILGAVIFCECRLICWLCALLSRGRRGRAARRGGVAVAKRLGSLNERTKHMQFLIRHPKVVFFVGVELLQTA